MRATHLLLALVPVSAVAQTEPIQHTLRFPETRNHYLEVESLVPTEGAPELELMMAVWTPGSYLVREYARNIETLTAAAASGPLQVRKTAKNRWRVETGGAASVVVGYRLYAREMSVRTNWVDGDQALLNGAATFLTRVDDLARPHEVRLELPAGWSESVTALPRHPDGEPHHYRAPDFDTLVDSPIMAGNPVVHDFEAGGVHHRLANLGGAPFWDEAASARDAQKIVEAAQALWGVVPYDDYVFLNAILERGGGLEHKGSTLMLTSRWRSRDPEGYRKWLSLVSHEFFHTWNVKRLRPAALGPFDYETENPTRSLWIAEGLTSYYGDLLLWRSGLLTRTQYLKELSGEIESLQTGPGRLVQPLEEASFDAWIKHYRPDENSRNSAVDYYGKGAVVGFLLDARIRRLTDGDRSLDDVMRAAWARYSGARGYTPEEFRAVVSEVAGADQSAWLQRALDTTEELDYAEALAYYGLRFADPDAKKKGKDEDEDERPIAWLGLEAEPRAGRLVVTRVARDTPAWQAGVSPEDEVLALDGFRVAAEGWEERLKQYAPGDEARLLVARRERLVEIPVAFEEKPAERWKLEVDPASGPAVKARLEALGGR